METSVSVFCSFSSREISNIESWLIPSLMRQKHIAGIDLYLINYTGKGERIYTGSLKRGIVSISEVNKGSACGFGEAHNFAFSNIKPSPYFLIVNPDVYLHELCVSELTTKIRQDEQYALVEARQLPYQHPKEYDRETGETPWASGCCIMVKADFFRAVGGFDELFWMYAEDVDLSWRAWLAGFRVVYHPPAVVYHYTGYYFSYNPYRFYTEHFWGPRNYLYMLYKYWGWRGMRRGIKMLKKQNYPAGFKDLVIKSFLALKDTIPAGTFLAYRRGVKRHADRIMVTGFNQYNKQNVG